MNNHGGSRLGSGRKKTGRSTKVVRVPEDFPSDIARIDDLIEVLKIYKASPNSSPRYYFLNRLISEFEDIL